MMASPEKPSLLDKATTQNVVSSIVVVTALIASIYYQKWEIASVIVGAAIGWLFPKTQNGG